MTSSAVPEVPRHPYMYFPTFGFRIKQGRRMIAVRCTQLGHFAEKCIICLIVAMCCQCAANVLPSDPRIVTVHLAMMEVLLPCNTL